MAAYVLAGQPVRTPLGTYARLADVSPDVAGWLAARVGVPVTLLHDGTAAAHAVPPDPRSVVVLLGTSLGVGFPHPHPA
jgi:predicted NBD/HSP70 family sugar kinase